MTDLESQLSQITDEDGAIIQDRVPLGQWIEARERELDGWLDLVRSDTYHPQGCGILIDASGNVTDYWALCE